jgi:hypothetical protein
MLPLLPTEAAWRGNRNKQEGTSGSEREEACREVQKVVVLNRKVLGREWKNKSSIAAWQDSQGWVREATDTIVCSLGSVQVNPGFRKLYPNLDQVEYLSLNLGQGNLFVNLACHKHEACT